MMEERGRDHLQQAERVHASTLAATDGALRGLTQHGPSLVQNGNERVDGVGRPGERIPHTGETCRDLPRRLQSTCAGRTTPPSGKSCIAPYRLSVRAYRIAQLA